MNSFQYNLIFIIFCKIKYYHLARIVKTNNTRNKQPVIQNLESKLNCFFVRFKIKVNSSMVNSVSIYINAHLVRSSSLTLKRKFHKDANFNFYYSYLPKTQKWCQKSETIASFQLSIYILYFINFVIYQNRMK